METIFYYLSADNRASLRNWLRPIYDKYTNSSLFQLEDKIYILIATNNASLAAECPELSPCEINPTPATPLELLLNWGVFELTGDHQQIILDHNAKTIADGWQLTFANQDITRLHHKLTEYMLIINNTPDSFSEAGKLYNNHEKILAEIEIAANNGVSIVDLGAESTRPDAAKIDSQEEIRRLEKIIIPIRELCNKYKLKLSLDSYKPETIERFIDLIDIINDQSGELPDKTLQQIIEKNKTYLCMHSLTIPANREINIPLEKNPLEIILDWAETKKSQLLNFGFSKDKIILDIGIGFNKVATQSWYLLNHAEKFHKAQLPILIGHSRKSFMNKITDLPNAERDYETSIISGFLSNKMIDYLRIHSSNFIPRLNKVNSQFI
ncbi:dihydropteroate synthase [Aquella oligotrophica]|uniref:dihydropteroate synthase n=1 Tax=Aquella oligotrophica TaxID=2067065 RepID=A0A2I7N7T7_9NEIS|nr:dihydropteroate synthase [Aquella oligotrophica]AUR52523.1 dihydropteroate synthase [Aquella oligotrophica]